jgi:hypothetical protein
MKTSSRRWVGVALVALSLCVAVGVQSKTGRITGRKVIAKEDLTAKWGWRSFSMQEKVGVNGWLVFALTATCLLGVGCVVWPPDK